MAAVGELGVGDEDERELERVARDQLEAAGGEGRGLQTDGVAEVRDEDVGVAVPGRPVLVQVEDVSGRSDLDVGLHP